MKSKRKRKYSIVQIYNLKVRKILFVFMIFPIFHYISFSFFVSFPLFVPSSKKIGAPPPRGRGGGEGIDIHIYTHHKQHMLSLVIIRKLRFQICFLCLRVSFLLILVHWTVRWRSKCLTETCESLGSNCVLVAEFYPLPLQLKHRK